MSRLAFCALAFYLTSAAQQTPSAADGCTPPGPELRAWMKEARSANVDDRKFLDALDAKVKGDMRFLWSTQVDASSSPAIDVMLLPRYPVYRGLLSEALRKMESIDDVQVPVGFILQVVPRQIDAPDIIRVVVQRDGVTIAPLSGKLEVQSLKTRMGAERMIHAGTLLYPCSAFLAGATVTITAIPETGTNLVARITSEDLGFMR